MEKFWLFILVSFFAINSLEKAESIQLEEIDEIFGEGWWDNDKAKEWQKLTLEQTFHHQIERQNTQLGQIEPNLADQNPPLTESDHFDNAKNSEEQNKIMEEIRSNKKLAENERKRKIIAKFHAIKDEFAQKRTFSAKDRTQIEEKISKHLKVNRAKIYKWKKEFGLSRKMFNEKERKNLIEKFDQMKAELKRAGFKNSYHHEIDETVAKALGLNFTTIYNWKSELGQSTPNKYRYSEKMELMKRYYEIKSKNLKISEGNIAKMLKIGRVTLYKWKKQFKRQQLHPNSVDGNVQEIGNSNSQSI